jgi:putative NIF3 family GTP cyclohydrolase 1 type 2
MDRRNFVSSAGLGAIYATLPGNKLLAAEKAPGDSRRKGRTAADVNRYLRSLCEVSEPSVDRIIIGDPDTPVQKIGTAWMPYWSTCKEAVRQGVNVLVVHEPTFYDHWDLSNNPWSISESPSPGQQEMQETIDKKMKWITENGLVIIRCHDVWDKIPDKGIPYAFGNALGFDNEDIIRKDTYYNVYRTDPAPAIDVARMIASKLEAVGQPGVAFYGDENHMIRSVGVGTGCICNPIEFMHLAPDLFIAIDDSVQTWVQTTWAEDTGKPLVVVNHGTSEEFGIRLLNEQLKNAFREYEVIHYKQGCTYKWVTA